MRIGIVLPFSGDLADAARSIENAGFDSAWVFDAMGRGFLLPDPFVALAVAGSVTSHIELGSCIIQVPLRHPYELAQRVATVQRVVGSRFLFGVGAGSTPDDFAALGVPFDDRFALLDSGLAAVLALLNG